MTSGLACHSTLVVSLPARKGLSMTADADGPSEQALAKMVSDMVESACCETSQRQPVNSRAGQQHSSNKSRIEPHNSRKLMSTHAASMADLVGSCVATALSDSSPCAEFAGEQEGGSAGQTFRKLRRRDAGLKCKDSRHRLSIEGAEQRVPQQWPVPHRSRSALARAYTPELPPGKANEMLSRKSSLNRSGSAKDVTRRKQRALSHTMVKPCSSGIDSFQGDSHPATSKNSRHVQSRGIADVATKRRPVSQALDTCSDQRASASSSSSAPLPRKRNAQIPTKDRASIWFGIFQRLMHEGEVHRDQLMRALDLGGVQELDQSWVEEIMTGITSCSTLNFDEFCTFIDSYRDRAHRHYRERFRVLDVSNSGILDATQLARLVASFGLNSMEHVIAEIITEIDEEGTGEFSCEDLIQVLKLVSDREGFAKAEYLRILRAFKDYDHMFTGRLKNEDVVNVLGLLNISTGEALAMDTIRQVDQEAKGELNDSMFLKVLGNLREVELVKIKEHLPESDVKGDRCTLQYRQLEGIWYCLGYFPDQEALHEAVEDAGFELPCQLTAADIWRILTIYREREGFSRSMSRDIELAFDKFDTQKKRLISISDVRRTFPVLGYATPGEVHDLVLHFTSQVDVSESGNLFLDQYKKVVRKYHEWTIQRAKATFASFKSAAYDTLPLGTCKAALKCIGCVDVHDKPMELVMDAGDTGDGVDVLTFVRGVLHHQWIYRDFVKFHAGYSIREVSNLRHQFRQYDIDSVGYVSNNNLLRLCSDLIPQLSTSQKLRPVMMEHMKQSGHADGLALDFTGFLQLTRLDWEIRDMERLVKERKIVQKLGLSSGEVKELRALFVDSDKDLRGALSFNQFVGLVDGLSTDCTSKRLEMMFSKVVSEHLVWDGRLAEFPEFLQLMRSLADIHSQSAEEDACREHM